MGVMWYIIIWIMISIIYYVRANTPLRRYMKLDYYIWMVEKR